MICVWPDDARLTGLFSLYLGELVGRGLGLGFGRGSSQLLGPRQGRLWEARSFRELLNGTRAQGSGPAPRPRASQQFQQLPPAAPPCQAMARRGGSFRCANH